jgi:hypothetical protein
MLQKLDRLSQGRTDNFGMVGKPHLTLLSSNGTAAPHAFGVDDIFAHWVAA